MEEDYNPEDFEEVPEEGAPEKGPSALDKARDLKERGEGLKDKFGKKPPGGAKEAGKERAKELGKKAGKAGEEAAKKGAEETAEKGLTKAAGAIPYVGQAAKASEVAEKAGISKWKQIFIGCVIVLIPFVIMLTIALTVYSYFSLQATGTETPSTSSEAVALKAEEITNQLITTSGACPGYVQEDSNPNNYHALPEGNTIGWPCTAHFWCTDLVIWSYKLGGGYEGATDWSRVTGEQWDWFKANGVAVENTAENQKSNPPQRGDVLWFYSSGAFGHNGISKSYDASTNIVTTLESNSGSISHTYNLNDGPPIVSGWGRLK